MKIYINFMKIYLKPLKTDQRKRFTQKKCKSLQGCEKNMECYERDTWKVHHKILNYSTFPTKITVKLLKFLMQKTSKQKKNNRKTEKKKQLMN